MWFSRVMLMVWKLGGDIAAVDQMLIVVFLMLDTSKRL